MNCTTCKQKVEKPIRIKELRLCWFCALLYKIMIGDNRVIKTIFLALLLSATAEAETFKVDYSNRTDAILPINTVYQYAPSAINTGADYLYWCGINLVTGDGDAIYQTSVDYINPQIVSEASQDINSAEGLHHCDPNILHNPKDNKFYLYIGTHPMFGGSYYPYTYQFVQASDDGIHFDAPKFLMSPKYQRPSYGLGQSEVVYIKPYFYMVYTDTSIDEQTRIFAARSRSPYFTKPEELVGNTWVGRTSLDAFDRTSPITIRGTFSLATVNGKPLFLINKIPNQTELFVYSKNFKELQHIVIPNINATESIGILRVEGGSLPKISRRKYKLTLFYSSGSGEPQDWLMKKTELVLRIK